MKYCQVNSDSEELDNFNEKLIIKPKRRTPKQGNKWKMFIKIVPIHVVQVETLVIQEQQQQNYEALAKQNQFGNQQYNGKN
jgi:ABC-type enterochelin transport system substrate-binding protein